MRRVALQHRCAARLGTSDGGRGLSRQSRPQGLLPSLSLFCLFVLCGSVFVFLLLCFCCVLLFCLSHLPCQKQVKNGNGHPRRRKASFFILSLSSFFFFFFFFLKNINFFFFFFFFFLSLLFFCFAAHGQNIGLTLNRFVAQSQGGVDPKQKEATFVTNSQQAAKSIQQMMVVLKGCVLWIISSCLVSNLKKKLFFFFVLLQMLARMLLIRTRCATRLWLLDRKSRRW